jgi:hypothetical protein
MYRFDELEYFKGRLAVFICIRLKSELVIKRLDEIFFDVKISKFDIQPVPFFELIHKYPYSLSTI